jgi:hypothetical protein
VLSAAAHGRTPGAEHIAHTAIVACAALDSRHCALYGDLVVACLSPTARHALEVLMPLQQFPPQSDIGKHFYAEGQKDGLRGLLLKQLARRFGPLPGTVMSRIQAAGSDLLEYWGERLLSAGSLDEVLAGAA